MLNLIDSRPVRTFPSWRTVALGVAVFALSFPLFVR